MVALNWQYVNASTMLNKAMFSGTAGWVLKPSSHWAQGNSDTRDLQRGTLSLKIEILAGQNLCAEGKKIHPYVKCEIHVDQARADHRNLDAQALETRIQSKDGEIKAKIEKGTGGKDADFHRQVLDFKDIPGISEDLTFVRYVTRKDRPSGVTIS